MIFLDHIDKNDVVVEAGANTGSSTLLLAKKAKHIFALEPNPKIFPYLRLNASRCKKITAYRAGLWSETGWCLLHTNDDLDKDASLVIPTENRFDRKIMVYRLDYLAKHFESPPNCLCLDMEGAEFHALPGSHQILENGIRKVMLETHYVNGRGTLAECETLLMAKGFERVLLRKASGNAEYAAIFCKDLH